METRFLKRNDLIECEVKGTRFKATIEAFVGPGWIKVQPSESWATWRWVRSRQVVKKLERQEQIAGVGAGRGERNAFLRPPPVEPAPIRAITEKQSERSTYA
jgi:hypothetical protein